MNLKTPLLFWFLNIQDITKVARIKKNYAADDYAE